MPHNITKELKENMSGFKTKTIALIASSLIVAVAVPPIKLNILSMFNEVALLPAVIAGVGKAFTVTVAVAVFVQLFEFVNVYVIVAVPALTPVTDPVDELTIAVAVFELDHVPPAGVKVVLDPIHTDVAPIAANVGKVFTVTTVDALVHEHPLLLVTVNV